MWASFPLLLSGRRCLQKKLGPSDSKTSHFVLLVHQVTYYEFQKDEVEAALDHHQKGHKPGNEVAQDVAERVHNKDAFNILMVRARKHARAGRPVKHCCACVHARLVQATLVQLHCRNCWGKPLPATIYGGLGGLHAWSATSHHALFGPSCACQALCQPLPQLPDKSTECVML